MSLLDKLNPITALAETADKILGRFFESPQDKNAQEMAKLQLRLAEEQAIREMEYQLEKLVVEDLANMREQIKVELQSEDEYVRRARPAWLYWLRYMYAGIFGGIPALSFIVTSVIAIRLNDVEQIAIIVPPMPLEFHGLVGALVLGYMWVRTQDKKNALKHLGQEDDEGMMAKFKRMVAGASEKPSDFS